MFENIKPIHTRVEKSIQTVYGTVVLESTDGFPQNECNLYCLTLDGKLLWIAEKPKSYTLYIRVKINDAGVTLSTYTLSSDACELDMQTGKILSKTRFR
ncbi:MAG: hypothetical protein QM730_08120 [Anaerolineales bacterium]